MPVATDVRIKSWKHRWETHPDWVTDVISCLRADPREEAAHRIVQLPWYRKENDFHPLTFSSDSGRVILDLRGIPLRYADLHDIIISFALLECADFYKSNLAGSDLSFIRAFSANFQQANLSEANLTASRLEGTDLSMANLNGASLHRARLEDADLGWSELKGAKLRRAHLQGANLERIQAQMADFSATELAKANLSMANCDEANFEEAKAADTRMVATQLNKANFSHAELDGSDLSLATGRSAIFTNASLKRCDLTRVHLEAADLYEAKLDHANLFAAHLDGAGFLDASLRGANLRAANFSRAYLKRADLRGTVLTNAYLLEANLEDADLRETDLTDCQFRSQKNSATVNADTQFGYSGNSQKGRLLRRNHSAWLYPPSSYLSRSERDLEHATKYRSLCNQVRMLYRDNGYFGRSAVYYEQENYWLTRIIRHRGDWRRYLFRLLFMESLLGYGEKPARVVLTGFLLMILFAIVFMFTGIGIPGKIIDYDWVTGFQSFGELIYDFWASMLFSMQCFATVSLGIVKPYNAVSLTLATFEGLLGIFLIALWLVVFVRKAVRD